MEEFMNRHIDFKNERYQTVGLLRLKRCDASPALR